MQYGNSVSISMGLFLVAIFRTNVFVSLTNAMMIDVIAYTLQGIVSR